MSLTTIKQHISRACSAFRKCYSGPWYKRFAMWLLTIAVGIILLFGAIDVNFLYLFGKSPGFDDIKNPTTNEASEIYSADSVLIGRYFNENRTPVEYEEISDKIIRTLVSTEDERFYQHHGIDFRGLISAIKDMFLGHARGGSTITQQLAKNLFRVRTRYSTGLCGHIPGVKLLVMKAKEWIVAVKLEILYSKEDILTMYFNTVDFGSNSFGIKTAARTYFGTTPEHLTYEQAATLVGLLKATSTYNPRLHPDNALTRRNTVLQSLYEHEGLIINNKPATLKQLDSIKAIPVTCVEHIEESNYDGIAPYFRRALQDYISMLCDKGLVSGTDSTNSIDLYADGLKIYTTIDTRIQKYAEESVIKQMRLVQERFDNHWRGMNPWQDERHQEIAGFIEDLAQRTSYYKYLSKRFNDHPDSIDIYLNKPHTVRLFSYDGPIEREISTLDSIRYMVSFMHCGFVAMDPHSREVKAWVGDIDFDFWKYDKVTAMRQPGSTFKLFVYTEAMNQGLTPCDRRVDEWKAYPDTIKGKPTIWAPHNANGYFTGANMPLKSAFAQSINSIAVKLGYEVGISNISRTAHAMGIQSPLNETPSLSLGSSDVNLAELVNAYCTVIADGKYNMPIMVNKIEDNEGHVLYEAKASETQAISYRSAYLMQQMLRAGLLERGGTTAALWEYIHPVLSVSDFGGKTGTSNNHSDAWFVGVTPNLVAGAWVGGEYRSIHFRTGQLGQGSRTALPVFGHFVAKLLADKRFVKYGGKFTAPKDPIDRSDWECAGYYHNPNDSLDADSILIDSEDAVEGIEEPSDMQETPEVLPEEIISETE
ncbi:MAG: penicillin-binding protein [Bacteroidaceae bacterium]|nr:penicillin-binding protein [Bacteroidaceae bacterium]